jgi:hypothetical protein
MSFSRGVNCRAAFHFLTASIWLRFFGQELVPLAWYALDASLNAAMLALFAWVLISATQKVRLEIRLFFLMILFVGYALLMFVARLFVTAGDRQMRTAAKAGF